jgi:hypothetical protein
MATSTIPDEIKLQCDLDVEFIVYELERFHKLELSEATFTKHFGEGLNQALPIR